MILKKRPIVRQKKMYFCDTRINQHVLVVYIVTNTRIPLV
jgi:hypothetical protein